MIQALPGLVFTVYSIDRLHPYGKGYVLQQLLGSYFIAPEQTEYLSPSSHSSNWSDLSQVPVPDPMTATTEMIAPI